jgi:hypothetical protein
MLSRITTLVRAAALAAVAAMPESAAAQPAGPRAPVATRAAIHGGHVLGIVKDETGRAIGGASVIALGPSSALAKTDTQGRFTLSLMPGEYILRASHDLYISTYREPVRINSSVRLEREITLLRPGSASDTSSVTAAMAKAGQAASGEAGREHSHSEAAWRLRHLVRTVLRDEASSGYRSEDAPPSAVSMTRAGSTASALLQGIDFSGQVNLLTSSSVGGPAGWAPDQWPRGIAYLAVGAQAGDVGDWRMRAAFSGGQGRAAAWVLLGELVAHEEAAHAYRVGISYGAQGFDADETRPWYATASTSRGVAGVYAFDSWTMRSGVTLDYGLRLDRYDYLADPELVSPTVGGRVAVLPRTAVTSQVSRRLVAPGADEFLPPPASGPWVPPERTFSSLVPRAPIRAEEVRHYEVGIEHEFGPTGDRTTLVARRFRQTTTDQVATIFGLGATSDLGHYFVATPGSVELDGWGVGVRQQWRDRIQAGASYSMMLANWDAHRQARAIRPVAPSAVRRGHERLHDLTASLEADIPESLTRVTVAIRANSAFARADGGARPVLDSRFDVEVHQALPYQPIQGGRLELLFAVRTLSRDGRNPGSIYDEVLTVAPPLRFVGGFQVRF